MYSNSEEIRQLMLKKKNKIKLFNNIMVVCYCGKDVIAINYKKHFKSKFHSKCNYYPPYYNKLFFRYKNDI
jgi:hypothetical protein